MIYFYIFIYLFFKCLDNWLLHDKSTYETFKHIIKTQYLLGSNETRFIPVNKLEWKK